ncbi:NUDIX hydrolase [Actinoplanes sp. SE50]|uniref:NUDIX hydrolase n=1 Tax=unclassified Actinoplanes TaxID=2626549 RepID=UPI00023EC090|nr:MULTISPECIES: NUDIX domain-containing protein [unclassified Actinoplanes]AEV83508.1 NUDIX hydrolase [Actinoplanes sp. SE50/110]ATO82348.1 NUDIX hydrolase [Actinoplanes sp. SE50]SLL99755.1 NUDIX hydrolase [Actinoplanes sp. SE50/110]
MTLNAMAVTVDLVLLTIRQQRLQVLLVRRGIEPFRGGWALPGGFVLDDEDLDDAARRELREETGVDAVAGHLEQLGTYGRPGRDPRGRVVTVAYLAMLPDLPAPVAGSDAAGAAWRPVDEAGDLAFDHDRILADGVERARAKLEYTPLATAFCPPEFTVADLRVVYESVWQVQFDPRNFHRKVTTAEDFIEPTGHSVTRERGRPAQLFRRGHAPLLHPPLLRPGSLGQKS